MHKTARISSQILFGYKHVTLSCQKKHTKIEIDKFMFKFLVKNFMRTTS